MSGFGDAGSSSPTDRLIDQLKKLKERIAAESASGKTIMKGLAVNGDELNININTIEEDALVNGSIGYINRSPYATLVYGYLQSQKNKKLEQREIYRRDPSNQGSLERSVFGCAIQDLPGIPVNDLEPSRKQFSQLDKCFTYVTTAYCFVKDSSVQDFVARFKKAIVINSVVPIPGRSALFPTLSELHTDTKASLVTSMYRDEQYLTSILAATNLDPMTFFQPKDLDEAMKSNSSSDRSHRLPSVLSQFLQGEDSGITTETIGANYDLDHRGEGKEGVYFVIRKNRGLIEYKYDSGSDSDSGSDYGSVHESGSESAVHGAIAVNNKFDAVFESFGFAAPGSKNQYVLCTTSWCGHCTRLKQSATWRDVVAPMVQGGAMVVYDLEQDAGQVEGVRIGKYPKHMQSVQVSSIPCLLLVLADGQVYRCTRSLNEMPRNDLQTFLAYM